MFKTCYQVNNACTVDREKGQWIDLGIHTDACMTNMMCGSAGGAISLWINVIYCPSTGGIASSVQSGTTGLHIYCTSNIVYDTHVLPIFWVVHEWSGLADLLTVNAIFF